MGHPAGDKVLVATGRRLADAVRPGDTVARLGGDEFVVLAEDIDDERAVMVLTERLRRVVAAPISLPERTVTVGVSVGVAISPPVGVIHLEGTDGVPGGDGATGPTALLSEADTALSEAKELGRDRSAVYNEAMRSVAARRLDVEELLRDRLRDGGVRVAYQPIIDLRSGLVVGTEALCRLADGAGVEVAPAEFIPVAEDSGLVVPLGLEVLDRALHRQAEVDAAGRDSHMAVNLSARQLAHPGIVGRVSRALGLSGVAPDRLVLELTESVLIDGGAQTRRSIEELHDMGVRLALDDFGTGWSSLSYLGRFPIHTLKIDRSFVSALGTPGEQQAIAEAIIGLARALRMVTVAEGVETEAQAEQLRAMGCDLAQGFLYSRPVESADLEAADLRWRSC
jgi:diguanylate cyclase (GGDEF)-like protein